MRSALQRLDAQAFVAHKCGVVGKRGSPALDGSTKTGYEIPPLMMVGVVAP